MDALGQKAILPLAILLSTIVAGIVACLIAEVPIVNILAAFGLITSLSTTLGGIFLYNQVKEVKQNTNGTLSFHQELSKDYIEFLKQAEPMRTHEALDKE